MPQIIDLAANSDLYPGPSDGRKDETCKVEGPIKNIPVYLGKIWFSLLLIFLCPRGGVANKVNVRYQHNKTHMVYLLGCFEAPRDRPPNTSVYRSFDAGPFPKIYYNNFLGFPITFLGFSPY